MLSIYRLPHMLEGEQIIKVVRRDFFIIFKKVLFFLLLAFLPLVFFYLSVVNEPELLYGRISYPLVVLGTSAYYLFLWLFFFFNFIDYYLDVWIITNERIIDIQQQGFFSRVISEQRLFRVQDVTSEVKGVWPTIFQYGNVHIQTAGAKERFYFQEVPNPDNVRDLIIKLIEISKARHAKEG